MGRRSEVLELAVLGLLHEGPRHGYELRKDLAGRLGRPYAVSFGSLYPTLRCLLKRGLTRLEPPGQVATGRARVVYALTPLGRSHFQSRICRPGPEAIEDDVFDVHFAFFARAESAARLHVLEGRRVRLQERREQVGRALTADEPADRYRVELRQHGLECVEQELRWLNRQIDLETHAQRESTPPRSN